MCWSAGVMRVLIALLNSQGDCVDGRIVCLCRFFCYNNCESPNIFLTKQIVLRIIYFKIPTEVYFKVSDNSFVKVHKI